MKDQNPIEKVRFYEKKQPNNAIMLKKRQVMIVTFQLKSYFVILFQFFFWVPGKFFLN